MASALKFDAVTIDSTDIDTDEFVSGSGRLTLTGNDVAPVTADGRIHNNRITITPSLEFEAYGDKSALNSDPGLSVAITAKRGGISGGSTVWQAMTGIVTAVYSESSKTTRISAACDPVSAAS